MSAPSQAPLPKDPFGLIAHPAFEPAARREATVFGAPAEICWLPDRKARQGVPKAGKPAFPAPFVDRILAEEAAWHGLGVVLTPNRFPFGQRQAVLWATRPIREPDAEFLAVTLAMAEAAEATVLINSVGAAASITRCHAHLLAEKLPFLAGFGTRPAPAEVTGSVANPEAIELLELPPPFPGTAVGVRGPVADRALAVHDLLHARSTPAFNLVEQDQVTWVFPRSATETPAPHFPHALGAAELWGRWCFADREPFERVTTQDLEQALRIGCFPGG